jgi:hypothetical protein
MQIKLQRVHFIPKELKPGVLYVSEEFGTAAHLCPCRCGAKIRTPLSPTDWAFDETEDGPTLRPSIGNWQQVCQSHYLIYRGAVIWCEQWTPEQISEGRRIEEKRRGVYYDAIDHQRCGLLRRLWYWVKGLFHG